jgi:hypothetical protein
MPYVTGCFPTGRSRATRLLHAVVSVTLFYRGALLRRRTFYVYRLSKMCLLRHVEFDGIVRHIAPRERTRRTEGSRVEHHCAFNL